MHRIQAPAYRERAETLIEDIKLLLLSDMEDSCSDSDDDLIKRLQIVDTIECLGIDQHFQSEIKVAVDYVYRLSIFPVIHEFHEFDLPFLGFTDGMHFWMIATHSLIIKTSLMMNRYWRFERGIGLGSRDSLIKDLNSTALGFRALRMHRYNVSSG
jgi:hypothetical protein